MAADVYYKWTANRKPVYGEGEYILDGGWQPRHEGPLIECESGYHVCREQDLPRWCGTELWEVEPDLADAVICDDKIIVRTWRAIRRLPWTWDDAVAYACWCAGLARRYAGGGSSAASRGALDAHNAGYSASCYATLVERAAHLSHQATYASELTCHARNVACHARNAACVAVVAAREATHGDIDATKKQLAWIMNHLGANRTQETTA